MRLDPAPPIAKTLFEGVNPILRIDSLTISLDYYVRTLGFKIQWEAPFFVCVSRDRCHLFLSEGDQGHRGTWIWAGVTDVDALFAEYTAAGARIRHPPTNYPWGREMQVADPDGNILRLGCETKGSEATGEWLDMEGHRWDFIKGRWHREV
ncbi:glyoxalase superfamily protein [Edaphobacter modestus]|uniref:Glyoxalase/bleomycin resistance protein/dioxygenase superfamily protein n=1 Tax=Edaphobacter modestus TaxID=388466 RepID=A0A4Q7Z066_9BACT|nr:glyoxalase superfamily protein [Edaphobacter modestus]RZU43530.1 glyoxalase/bleomycin resistance protein/dioxygenase superfamily protein [Edaphobacter modestus]